MNNERSLFALGVKKQKLLKNLFLFFFSIYISSDIIKEEYIFSHTFGIVRVISSLIPEPTPCARPPPPPLSHSLLGPRPSLRSSPQPRPPPFPKCSFCARDGTRNSLAPRGLLPLLKRQGRFAGLRRAVGEETSTLLKLPRRALASSVSSVNSSSSWAGSSPHLPSKMADTGANSTGLSFLERLKSYCRTPKGFILASEIVSSGHRLGKLCATAFEPPLVSIRSGSAQFLPTVGVIRVSDWLVRAVELLNRPTDL